MHHKVTNIGSSAFFREKDPVEVITSMEDVIQCSISMLVALTSDSPRPFEPNAATIRASIG